MLPALPPKSPLPATIAVRRGCGAACSRTRSTDGRHRPINHSVPYELIVSRARGPSSRPVCRRSGSNAIFNIPVCSRSTTGQTRSAIVYIQSQRAAMERHARERRLGSADRRWAPNRQISSLIEVATQLIHHDTLRCFELQRTLPCPTLYELAAGSVVNNPRIAIAHQSLTHLLLGGGFCSRLSAPSCTSAARPVSERRAQDGLMLRPGKVVVLPLFRQNTRFVQYSLSRFELN